MKLPNPILPATNLGPVQSFSNEFVWGASLQERWSLTICDRRHTSLAGLVRGELLRVGLYFDMIVQNETGNCAYVLKNNKCPFIVFLNVGMKQKGHVTKLSRLTFRGASRNCRDWRLGKPWRVTKLSRLTFRGAPHRTPKCTFHMLHF